MEAPFPQFKPSSTEGLRHFHATQFMLTAPLYVSLVLMIAQGNTPGPGLWSVFGFAVGLSLILAGLRRTCFDKDVRTRWGQHLCNRSDFWMPWILFGARCASIALTTALFWAVAVENGMPATLWIHILIIAILIFFFAYQWASAMATHTERTVWISAAEFLRYALYTLAAFLGGGLITLFAAPPGHRIPSEQHMFIVLLWIAVLMVPVVCSLLWTNHLLSRRAEQKNQAGPR